MRPLMMALAMTLVTLSTAFAAGNFPPSFDAVSWKNLVRKTIHSGAKMQTDDGWIYYLSKVNPPDLSEPHKADYFTVRGIEANNKFVPLEVNTVTEDWQIDAEGNWQIDQLIRLIKPDGELAFIYHGQLIERQDGTVVSTSTLPSGAPSSESELKSWGAKLAEWLAD